MDFRAASQEDRRSFQILTVVDQFTRECIALLGKPGLNRSVVAEAMDMAVRERGKPTSIMVCNRSESAWKVMDA